MFIFTISLILLLISALPYLYYLFGIKFGRKAPPVEIAGELPDISIIISAYNEERAIGMRIRNLIGKGYPPEKYELIFIDDASTDYTKEIALSELKDSGVSYRILSNETRLGTNRSYNFAMKKAKNEIVVTTDANKFFEKDALQYLISGLISDSSIAAVCADVRPIRQPEKGGTGGMESAYRNFYGRMCAWESANDSTYNFNGALVAFRKSIIGSIKENRGADDANTAFEAIRKGCRAVYVSESVIYEKIPVNLHRQYRQKVRRAKRLIEATLSNLDLLKERRPFSRRFYPARIMIYTASPALFLFGGFLFIVSIFILNLFAGLITAVVLAAVFLLNRPLFVSSFIVNQLYLFFGLLKINEDTRTWESTSV